MEGRYMDGHRFPWNLMAWSFCRVSEEMPPQFKTSPHLQQEVAEVMSCGGGVFIYDTPQRSGWLNEWHQDILAEVAEFCRLRQPFCQFTRSIPDAAVLVGDHHVWRRSPEAFCLGDAYHGFEGALHVLIENQVHVDVLDETRLGERLATYSLVVVAEQDPVSSALLEELESFAKNGGVLLMTGAHLADLCPNLVGVVPIEPPIDEPWHIPIDGECATLQGPWRPVKPVPGTQTLFPIMGGQSVGKDERNYPAATLRTVGKGRVVAIHGRIMESYLLSHHPRIRRLIQSLLGSAEFEGRVKVDGPPSLEVSLREGRNFTAVHLVNRAVNPTLTPRAHIVETVPPTGPVSVKLQIADEPKEVLLEPGKRPVAWGYQEGRLTAEIPSVAIHDILVATTRASC